MEKILSLDGGPGPLMELRVIERLQQHFERYDKRGGFLEQATVFAGTSDGGLMALYFAKGLTEQAADRAAGRTPRSTSEIIAGCMRFSDDYAAALSAHTHHLASLLEPFAAAREIAFELASAPELRQNIIKDRAKKIARFPVNVVGALKDLWNIRKTLVGEAPLTDAADFQGHLQRAFGDWTLGRLTKKVVVLSFDTTAWKPRAYRNFWAEDDLGTKDRGRDETVSLVEAGMSTAAMPLFLPIYGGRENRGYLDGIFSANNPVASAVTLVLRHLVDANEGNPFEKVVALSMGVSQTVEEANIEHSGGLGSLLDLFSVEDRATRMGHSARPEEFKLYLRDLAVRLKVHEEPKRKGVGSKSWGWLDYVRRPTFVVNMLIHGMNGESSAQAGRLLRGNFFRHAPRVHLARTLFRTVFMGTPVRETDLPLHAALCFRESFDDSRAMFRTRDEEKNANETDELIKWLGRKWFPPQPPPEPSDEPEHFVS